MVLAGYPRADPGILSGLPPAGYVRERREASSLCGGAPARTAVEILRCGSLVEERLCQLATARTPPSIDERLVASVHRGWFETTFPEVAGQVSHLGEVLARWNHQPRPLPAGRGERLSSAVSSANGLARVLLSANPLHTRTAYSIRNYALMLSGASRVVRLPDGYEPRGIAGVDDPAWTDELVLSTLTGSARDA
jgi:hypothetical protein